MADIVTWFEEGLALCRINVFEGRYESLKGSAG